MGRLRLRGSARLLLDAGVTGCLIWLPGILCAQELPNPEYELSIKSPVDGPFVGIPGTELDDGTWGWPLFKRPTRGRTFDIVLLKRNSPESDIILGKTRKWSWAIGASDGLQIVGVTLEDTISCQLSPIDAECIAIPSLYTVTLLTGAPFGVGPATRDNHGAVSIVFLGVEGVFIPGDGAWVIGRIRVSGSFPAENATSHEELFFTERYYSEEESVRPSIVYGGSELTETFGNPPIETQGYSLTLQGTSDPQPMVRCDVNADDRVDLGDAIWILKELFLGWSWTRCHPAADCDGNGERDLTDAVYLLTHLFLGGPPPPEPYPTCGHVDVPLEDCPPGSTQCP